MPESVQARQPNNRPDSIDLVELMYRLLAKWKLIACLAVAFAIVAGVYTFFFIMWRKTALIWACASCMDYRRIWRI